MKQKMINKNTEGVLPMDGENLEGKVLVLDGKRLSKNYCRPVFQFWKAIGGFGCSPDLRGKSVFSECLLDEDKNSWRRDDFIGIASDELVKKFLI